MALSGVERRLCDLIGARAADLLDDLRRHVAIPTGGGYAPGLDEYRGLLAERLVALGARIEAVPADARPPWLALPGESDPGPGQPTLLARQPGARKGPRLLLVGHLDTVHDPAGAFRELSMSPGGATATGPGAADMKGGIVIALAALEAIAEAGIAARWTFLLNADEETGSFGSASALRAAAAGHDVGLVMEPALPGGVLAIERLGSGQFRIDAFGRSAHAGRDFAKGVSAVFALAETIVALERLVDPAHGLVVNVGPLQGGLVTNTVPDRAACWGNVRFPDTEACDRLGEAIDALARDEGLPRIVVQKIFNRPAKPATDPVRRLAEAARAAAADLGAALPTGSTGGVCDGNILQDAGLPTLDTLGVCGGNLHRTDEFVEVASLVARCRLLAVFMCRLAEGRAGVH